jgi:hypothetical protein
MSQDERRDKEDKRLRFLAFDVAAFHRKTFIDMAGISIRSQSPIGLKTLQDNSMHILFIHPIAA